MLYWCRISADMDLVIPCPFFIPTCQNIAQKMVSKRDSKSERETPCERKMCGALQPGGTAQICTGVVPAGSDIIERARDGLRRPALSRELGKPRMSGHWEELARRSLVCAEPHEEGVQLGVGGADGWGSSPVSR